MGEYGKSPCEECGKPDNYCSTCSTCHSCLEESINAMATQVKVKTQPPKDLLSVTLAMREWIDAVPSDTVLPTMPGFDRDWADSVIDKAMKQKEVKA
jgi:hypothetical protein